VNAGDRIDAVLDEACKRGTIPGGVAAVADADGVVYHRAFGWADPDRAEPLDDRSVFRLASMTKLITAVAVLRLVDSGQIGLDDPFTRHVAELGAIGVLDGFDGDLPLVRPVARPPTVREVLRYQTLTGTPAISSGRIGVLDTPLVADPGTIVEYGTGFDWAGRLLERVSGSTLDEYCRREIFEPLGMTRTSLRPLTDPPSRYVAVLREQDNGFVATDIDYPHDPDFATGGGCFYSTAGDYLTLQRALLAGGTLGGVGILSADGVDQLLAAQSWGEVPPLRTALPWLSADVDLGSGWHWGFGLMVNGEPIPGGRNAASGGWWGIFNTTFWIDRRAGIAANLFMQFVPFYSPAAASVARDFERAVYASFG
jgi:methyl acetate hydrolase